MDPDFVTSHRYSYCKFPRIGQGVVTFRDPSSASPQFYVNFNFSCQQTFCDYVSSPDVMIPTQFVRQVDQPLLRKTVRVMCIDQKTNETIDEELKDWPLEDIGRARFIKIAIERAQTFIQSIPPHHNVLDIDFRVVGLQSNIYSSVIQYEQHLLEQESEEEEEESEEEEEEDLEEENSSCFMVPAMDSCIESLERKIVDEGCGRNQNCTICMDEFPDGSEVMSMPCSHIFHGDCIQKWLRTSHHCPLCRFEMPTS